MDIKMSTTDELSKVSMTDEISDIKYIEIVESDDILKTALSTCTGKCSHFKKCLKNNENLACNLLLTDVGILPVKIVNSKIKHLMEASCFLASSRHPYHRSLSKHLMKEAKDISFLNMTLREQKTSKRSAISVQKLYEQCLNNMEISYPPNNECSRINLHNNIASSSQSFLDICHKEKFQSYKCNKKFAAGGSALSSTSSKVLKYDDLRLEESPSGLVCPIKNNTLQKIYNCNKNILSSSSRNENVYQLVPYTLQSDKVAQIYNNINENQSKLANASSTGPSKFSTFVDTILEEHKKTKNLIDTLTDRDSVITDSPFENDQDSSPYTQNSPENKSVDSGTLVSPVSLNNSQEKTLETVACKNFNNLYLNLEISNNDSKNVSPYNTDHYANSRIIRQSFWLTQKNMETSTTQSKDVSFIEHCSYQNDTLSKLATTPILYEKGGEDNSVNIEALSVCNKDFNLPKFYINNMQNNSFSPSRDEIVNQHNVNEISQVETGMKIHDTALKEVKNLKFIPYSERRENQDYLRMGNKKEHETKSGSETIVIHEGGEERSSSRESKFSNSIICSKGTENCRNTTFNFDSSNTNKVPARLAIAMQDISFKADLPTNEVESENSFETDKVNNMNDNVEDQPKYDNDNCKSNFFPFIHEDSPQSPIGNFSSDSLQCENEDESDGSFIFLNSDIQSPSSPSFEDSHETDNINDKLRNASIDSHSNLRKDFIIDSPLCGTHLEDVLVGIPYKSFPQVVIRLEHLDISNLKIPKRKKRYSTISSKKRTKKRSKTSHLPVIKTENSANCSVLSKDTDLRNVIALSDGDTATSSGDNIVNLHYGSVQSTKCEVVINDNKNENRSPLEVCTDGPALQASSDGIHFKVIKNLPENCTVNRVSVDEKIASCQRSLEVNVTNSLEKDKHDNFLKEAIKHVTPSSYKIGDILQKPKQNISDTEATTSNNSSLIQSANECKVRITRSYKRKLVSTDNPIKFFILECNKKLSNQNRKTADLSVSLDDSMSGSLNNNIDSAIPLSLNCPQSNSTVSKIYPTGNSPPVSIECSRDNATPASMKFPTDSTTPLFKDFVDMNLPNLEKTPNITRRENKVTDFFNENLELSKELDVPLFVSMNGLKSTYTLGKDKIKKSNVKINRICGPQHTKSKNMSKFVKNNLKQKCKKEASNPRHKKEILRTYQNENEFVLTNQTKFDNSSLSCQKSNDQKCEETDANFEIPEIKDDTSAHNVDSNNNCIPLVEVPASKISSKTNVIEFRIIDSISKDDNYQEKTMPVSAEPNEVETLYGQDTSNCTEFEELNNSEKFFNETTRELENVQSRMGSVSDSPQPSRTVNEKLDDDAVSEKSVDDGSDTLSLFAGDLRDLDSDLDYQISYSQEERKDSIDAARVERNFSQESSNNGQKTGSELKELTNCEVPPLQKFSDEISARASCMAEMHDNSFTTLVLKSESSILRSEHSQDGTPSQNELDNNHEEDVEEFGFHLLKSNKSNAEDISMQNGDSEVCTSKNHMFSENCGGAREDRSHVSSNIVGSPVLKEFQIDKVEKYVSKNGSDGKLIEPEHGPTLQTDHCDHLDEEVLRDHELELEANEALHTDYSSRDDKCHLKDNDDKLENINEGGNQPEIVNVVAKDHCNLLTINSLDRLSKIRDECDSELHVESIQQAPVVQRNAVEDTNIFAVNDFVSDNDKKYFSDQESQSNQHTSTQFTASEWKDSTTLSMKSSGEAPLIFESKSIVDDERCLLSNEATITFDKFCPPDVSNEEGYSTEFKKSESIEEGEIRDEDWRELIHPSKETLETNLLSQSLKCPTLPTGYCFKYFMENSCSLETCPLLHTMDEESLACFLGALVPYYLDRGRHELAWNVLDAQMKDGNERSFCFATSTMKPLAHILIDYSEFVTHVPYFVHYPLMVSKMEAMCEKGDDEAAFQFLFENYASIEDENIKKLMFFYYIRFCEMNSDAGNYTSPFRRVTNYGSFSSLPPDEVKQFQGELDSQWLFFQIYSNDEEKVLDCYRILMKGDVLDEDYFTTISSIFLNFIENSERIPEIFRVIELLRNKKIRSSKIFLIIASILRRKVDKVLVFHLFKAVFELEPTFSTAEAEALLDLALQYDTALSINAAYYIVHVCNCELELPQATSIIHNLKEESCIPDLSAVKKLYCCLSSRLLQELAQPLESLLVNMPRSEEFKDFFTTLESNLCFSSVKDRLDFVDAPEINESLTGSSFLTSDSPDEKSPSSLSLHFEPKITSSPQSERTSLALTHGCRIGHTTSDLLHETEERATPTSRKVNFYPRDHFGETTSARDPSRLKKPPLEKRVETHHHHQMTSRSRDSLSRHRERPSSYQKNRFYSRRFRYNHVNHRDSEHRHELPLDSRPVPRFSQPVHNRIDWSRDRDTPRRVWTKRAWSKSRNSY